MSEGMADKKRELCCRKTSSRSSQQIPKTMKEGGSSAVARPYLYRSYPAAKALPLVGVLARSLSFLTSNGGFSSTLMLAAGPSFSVEASAAPAIVLARLARGEVGADGGR